MKRLLLILFLLVAVAPALATEYEKEWSFLGPGNYKIEVDDTLHAFRVRAEGNSRIKYRDFQDVENPPEDVRVYEYVEVEKENRITDFALVFGLPKSWLWDMNATADDVRVLKRSNGDWALLEHEPAGETQHTLLFQVRVETLSTFAVGIVRQPKGADGAEEDVEVICPEPEVGECVNRKRTRTYYEVVDGECVERNETLECAVELGGRPDYTQTYLAVGALLSLTLGVGYFVFHQGSRW